MIDALQELVETGFCAMLLAAVVALPVALLVLGIDRLAGRWLSPNVRCWLWVLVAARLLMPVAPGSPVSAQHVWRMFSGDAEPAVASVQPAPPFTPTVESFMAQPPVPTHPRPSTSAPAGFDWEALVVGIMFAVWLIGVVSVLLRAIVASVRFGQQLRQVPSVDDAFTLDIVQSVCHQVGVRQPPKVKCVPGLPAPALFGLFRPTLCLPEGGLPDTTRSNLSAAELRMILIHEVMHLRRWDGYFSWLLTLVRAVHWFNPVAWLTVRKVEMYRELACDDAVRRFTAPEERSGYADLLLRFATERPAASLGLLGLWLAPSAKRLTARIEAFTAADGDRRWLPTLAAAVLLLSVAAVGLTDVASADADAAVPMSPQATPQASTARTPAFEFVDIESPLSRDQRGAVETRVYDMTEALEKIAETRPQEQDARTWLLTFLKLPCFEKGNVRIDDGFPNQITLVASPKAHEFFANLLSDIRRFGCTWQVTVATRVFRSDDLDAIEGVNWQQAVRFASPKPNAADDWSTHDEPTGGERLSLSMESVSFEYAPYLAFVLDEEKMARLVDRLQSDARASLLQAPKVTLFSGQLATISDQSQRPFVVGVDYVEGAFAAAAQPTIAVLAEGAQLDVLTRMVDRETIDLNCRLTLSFIDGVSEAKLPGQNVTIQTPRATRRSISARCQVKKGETLLIAPLAGSRGEDKEEGFFYYAITTDWFRDPVEIAD